MKVRTKDGRSGAALVEFAITALVLYVLVIGGIELGRAIFVSQVLQQAARVAARELAVTPLSATYTFDCPMAPPGDPAYACYPDMDALDNVPAIWDPNQLVIDISCGPTPDALDSFLSALPLVNRALRPVFIYDDVVVAGTERKLLRYPGALLAVTTPVAPANTCPQVAPDLTVGIPQVNSRASDGTETIEWLPVLQEIRPPDSDPACGPFSFTPIPESCPNYNMNNPPPVGIVSLAINYPFQSGGLTGFRQQLATQADPNHDPLAPNLGYAIEANDAGVAQVGNLPANTALVDPEPPDCPPNATCPGIYAGPYGLGRQFALLKTVRPFRRLLQGQAIFRREVTSN